MTGRHHFERAGRTRYILNRSNDVSRGQEQGDDDKNRNHSPRELHLVASVYLRGLTAVVVMSIPEPHYRVGEQTEDDDEYDRDGHQDENGESENRLRRSRGGGGDSGRTPQAKESSWAEKKAGRKEKPRPFPPKEARRERLATAPAAGNWCYSH